MEYITRGVCGQEGCRERRYYLDNGLWFCRRGHQQEGRQVEEDPDDFGTQGKTHRVKKAVAEKIQKTYRGRQAYSLFLQVYQLILWKQCYALVHEGGFPAEFENVVRGMWALRLQSFSEKIQEHPDADAEPEIFSSQPALAQESEEVPKLSGKHVEWPRLIDSLALCYLGALLMRLPVSVEDVYRMAMREDIPFIRIIKTIPREMRDKLPQEYLSLLETKGLPQAEQLHNAVLDLAKLYHHKFGMEFPPLNSPLLLFRFIKRLVLPVEVYPAFKKLEKLVGFSFAYPKTIINKKRALDLPELQMMTLLVILTKLFFPFDELQRYPVSAKEPTTQVIKWELWAQIQRHFDSRETSGGRIGKGNEVLVSEKDVFNMTPAQLDEYMDWYENSWLDNSRAYNPLADMFPISRAGAESRPGTPPVEASEDEAIKSMLQAIMSQVQPRKVIPEPDDYTPRPGSSYQRYRTESNLPETAKPFYETAAQVVGVSLPTLVRAVFQAEYKMARWQEDQRRTEYHEEDFEMEFERGASADEMDEMDDQEASDMEDRH